MTATTRPAPRRMRKAVSDYHHGDLRAALVHATVVEVERRGLESLTLKGVARRVGVSAPAAYHHFRNKTDLIAAAVAFAFDALDRGLADAEQSSDSEPANRLETLAIAYVRFAILRRGEFRLTFGGHVAGLGLSRRPEVMRPGRSAKARIRKACGEAFGSAGESEQRFAILWGQLVGIAALIVERELGPGLGVDEAVQLARTAVHSHLLGLARKS